MLKLLDWLNELIIPGSVGELGVHKNSRNRTRLSSILTGIPAFAIVLIPIIRTYANRSDDPKLFGYLFTTFFFESVYLLASYFIKPEPDNSNLGWLGGMFDDPYQITDNFNRFLYFLLVIFFPGRLISIGLIDLAKALIPRKLWSKQPERNSKT